MVYDAAPKLHKHQLQGVAWDYCAVLRGGSLFVVQNESHPAEIQDVLYDLTRNGVVSARICCAYVTLSGSQILFDAIRRGAADGNHAAIPKTIVTSLDFGLTDPAALQFWRDTANSQVLIAGAGLLRGRNLIPAAAFHPKLYMFGAPNGTVSTLVSSANLTNRGLTINSEVGWVARGIDAEEGARAWNAAIEGTVPLTDEILDQYRAIRAPRRQLVPTDILRVPPARVGNLNQYDSFADVPVNPADFSYLWIQSAGMQGGARTQLELPRGAHRFFGAAYPDYDYERVDHIAEPVLVAGRREWRDRPLTWHGDNRMERINLPSLAMGGFEYENSLILFRRIAQNIFELRVYPWDSDSARAYVESSRRANLLFRVGRASPRLCGLLP